jgi:hypothetical protein
VFRRRSAVRRPIHRPQACRLRLEVLDDRIVPTVSTIASNFNGTKIAAGSTVWFNSVLKVSGVGSSPVTIHVSQGTITSSAFTVNTPDADITFSPTATSATTAYDAGTNTWTTVVPTGLGGNTFLDGVAAAFPAGLRGGLNPVTWSANFTTDAPGITLQWQWTAAVYTSFSTDYSALGVKPVDSNSASVYHNSDHAGTPEVFKAVVVGGARGGGGSNFTGSYSATKAVTPDLTPPPPPPSGSASVSGFVYLDNNHDGVRQAGEVGESGITITLTGFDLNGNAVTMSTTTADDGSYTFTGLAAGTYQLTEDLPPFIPHGTNAVGTVNGTADGTLVGDSAIGSIILMSGDVGSEYDFAVLPPPS